MEVMLRGSLGHLELRRMRFDRAEAELSAAELLARRHSTAAVRARILNNLGVLHNHRGDLDAARRAYSRAQQLLARIGDERGVVLAMCNLAIIAAKTGDPEAGRGAIDEATALVEKLPDPRLELYVDLATGLVAHARCDAAAAPPFRRAIDRARALGDAQFAAFAEVYLAETEICCARYTEALNRLRAAATCSSKVPGLARMARTRRAFVEALLGRADSAKKTERSLDETPRTDVALLEAWNDLVLAATRSILGEPAADIFRRARLAFHELGVPAGERLAVAGELWAAVQEANRSAVQRLQSQLQLETPEPNRLLAVLQPIVLAEASIFLADEVAAKSLLEAAAGAIVGAPSWS
jgi:tetratricopeptide (TPR) repeat protein